MSTQISALTKENAQDINRLSPTQEGMLFHTLLGPDSVVYLQQKAYRMQGRLDRNLIEKAFDEVVRRHDVLRTVFKYAGTTVPLQIVLKERQIKVAYHDLRSIHDVREKEREVERLKEVDRSCSVDLTKGPLMQLTLVQKANDEYELIWSCHHILIDGWCLGILQSEFLEIYDSLSEQRPYQLPQPKPFSSYIQWLESQEKDEAKQFWQTYLEGYTDAISFPRQRNLVVRNGGYYNKRITTSLSLEDIARLRNLASEHQVSVAQLLSAIWGVLLAKYTSANDIIFGLVVSGRPATLEGVEGMMGLFINTLPVRMRFDGQMPFTTLLRTLSQELLAADSYSFFPLNEIQALAKIKGGLFDHILTFHNPPDPQVTYNTSTDRAIITGIETFEQTSYDLCIDIILQQNIQISFTFNANVYEPSFIQRTSAVFAMIMDQLLADPTIPLGRLSLMTKHDQELLDQFNQTDREFPCDRSVAQILEGFANTHPQKIVLECGGRRFSYRDLDLSANRLARLLRDQFAVKPNDIVALLMERSETMVVSILALWKLGAAYLPVDIDYPIDHITELVTDSGAKAILVNRNEAGTWPEEILSPLTGVFAFSDLNESIAQFDGAALSAPFDPKQMVYVIYTSGSTGKPKGVMIELVGMLNHLYAKIDDLQLDAHSIVAQDASHCFDISVWQFFAALLVGGRIIIYPKRSQQDPQEFINNLAHDKVNILEAVPSYLSVLLETVAVEKLKKGLGSLKYLVSTGEILNVSLAERWFEIFPGIPMVNTYGATEASDDTSHYTLVGPPAAGEPVPLGGPIANLKIYVVDEFMNRCPIGIKGEILFSGVGVGPGYLHDPQKTERAFIEDPFCKKRNIRMYRTGDLGYFREDGLLEFVGRQDNQVKIHGFRVELQAIENVMLLHPAVRGAAVVDKKGQDGNDYLAGYLTTTEAFDSDEFRDFLSKKLPKYSIPAYISVLSEFPTTISRKIDRKALKDLDVSIETRTGGDGYVAPRDETEVALAEIWKDVLKVNQVSIKDNFFELGGDSFRVIRVVSRFGKGLSVPNLYEHPTIEELGEIIRLNKRNGESLLYQLTPPTIKAKYAVIIIPNGGGDPSVYRETANALTELSNEYACYGVVLTRPQPQNVETLYSVLETITNNIIIEIKQKIHVPIILFGQCNGSALALRLAKRMEEEQIACRAIGMSGQLPMSKKMALDDSWSEEQIFEFLDSLGASYPAEPEDKIIFMHNLRYDTVLARTSYNQSLEEMATGRYKKLSTTLHCIVGEEDPLTKNYKHRYKNWGRYAERVGLIVIKGVGHYAWRDKPRELGRVIFDIGEGNVEAGEAVNPAGLFSKLGGLLSGR